MGVRVKIMVKVHQSTTSTEDVSATASTHCVFRRGSSWLALPALAVREALPRPEMVFVPGTPKTFVGLCHVRSEFIPVLNLDSVLSAQSHSGDRIMLILDDADGPWGVLVDEVSSLQPLEVSDAPDVEAYGSESAVIGWATQREFVIQVLDQDRIRRIAEQELSTMWQSADPLSQNALSARLREELEGQGLVAGGRNV